MKCFYKSIVRGLQNSPFFVIINEVGVKMIYILYNSKSNRGKPIWVARKLARKFKRKKQAIQLVSFLELNGKIKGFHDSLVKEDILYLIGGDGTFHYYLNHVYPSPITYRIFILASGRGNDLARDYRRHKPFEITHLVNELPTITINHELQYEFINGIGMGVDSFVCDRQLQNGKKKKKESYFRVALSVFKTFKPYPLDIEIDGISYHYEKVWFFVCNHGRYFGGGMKITPKAKREDDHLDVCIVHGIKLWSLLLAFPLVFLGLHRFVRKKWIHFFKAKHIIATPYHCNLLQMDGEVAYKVTQIEVHRLKNE